MNAGGFVSFRIRPFVGSRALRTSLEERQMIRTLLAFVFLAALFSPTARAAATQVPAMRHIFPNDHRLQR